MSLVFLIMSVVGSASGYSPCKEKPEERIRPCTASMEEKGIIRELMEAGVAAYEEFEDAKQAESALRKYIASVREGGREPDLNTRKKWAAFLSNAEDAEKRMNNNFKYAIEKTKLFYGLHQEKRTIINGPLKDIQAEWNAEFVYAPKKKNGGFETVVRSAEIHRRDAPATKHLMAVSFRENTRASTDEDGATSVSIKAFRDALENDEPAGVLASTLYHESIHFEGLAVKGGWASKEAVEVAAWGAELEVAAIFEQDASVIRAELNYWKHQSSLVDQKRKKPTRLFPKDAEEAKKLQESFADQEAWAKWASDKIQKEQFALQQDLDRKLVELKERTQKAAEERRHLGELDNLARGACITGSFDRWFFGQFKPHVARDLYCEKRSVADAADIPCLSRVYHDMLGQLCDNGSIDADELEGALRARFGGGPVEARPGPAVPPPGLGVEPISPPTAIFELADLAAKACAAPGSVTEKDVRYLNWFPDRNITRWPAAREKLNDCSRPIFDALLGLNDSAVRGVRPNEIWINTTAQAWARAHPPEPPPSGPPETDERPEKDRTPARCYYDPELGQNVCPVR